MEQTRTPAQEADTRPDEPGSGSASRARTFVGLALAGAAVVAVWAGLSRDPSPSVPDASPEPATTPRPTDGFTDGTPSPTTSSPDATAAPDTLPPPALGVNGGRAGVDQVAEFEALLGRPVDIVQDAIRRETWDQLDDPSDELEPWQESRFASYDFVLNVGMLPHNEGSLAEGAAGAYDDRFRQLAERLVEEGFGDAIIRLGHEANAHWFDWAAAQDPNAYVQYFRRIVEVMRDVPGSDFRFDWTVARGSQAVPADSIYPGDDVVDIIGMDVYDQDPEHPPGEERWQKFRTQPYGLDWLSGFAAARGKPISIGEWGVAATDNGNGGGDNPYFIDRMHEWIDSNSVLYHVYFEVDAEDGAHRLTGELFPASAAAFRERFGE
jgi:hypothetical protein